MVSNLTEVGSQYSVWVGLVFLFNLIVGTGALTLPLAFYKAGWLLGIFVLIILAIMSYAAATFMVESMATANMRLRYARKQIGSLNGESIVIPDSQNADHDLVAGNNESLKETQPLIDMADDEYAITERLEMGTMATMFFNKVGILAFYACIALYLYGDLAIYSVSIPKSLRDAMCTYHNLGLADTSRCWPGSDISRMNAYRIAVTAMAVFLCPFVFFDLQKSKYLQAVTSVIRWLGMLLMIILALIRLSKGEGLGRPQIADIHGLPNLFGVCVYAFMCHHSLPSVLTPLKDKSKISLLMTTDYLLILGFYALLSFTAIFSFDNLKDLYTLNFIPDWSNKTGHLPVPATTIVPFQYFLVLFPVFTLGSTYPILGITLRNNLKILFSSCFSHFSPVIDRFVFPIITVLPPLAVAMATTDVNFLVGFTGSYAGAGIQYVIPSMLVWCSRREVKRLGIIAPNKYKSMFRHNLWVWVIIVWSVICVVFVTVNHIITHK